MITLRLDPKLEQAVDSTARTLGLTKSELIRKSIRVYLDGLGKQDPWEAGKDLFGKYSSGMGVLSSNRKDLVKKKIRAKSDGLVTIHGMAKQ